jgi:low temperature requirement protein LtrA
MSKQHYNIWWGPPKKFSTQIAERKISWLELFYDLVYVIVISRTTHYLATHPSWSGLLDYIYLFTMIFWGWFMGSIYHDLHGSPGIRTRFMTLWQMMAAGALAVTLDSPPESIIIRTTLAIMFLQLFITYLLWSVGLYDKQHRKLNRPYTFWFLAALVLLVVTFWIPFPYKRLVYFMALGFNFIPFVLSARKLKKEKVEFTLSSNMTERLGLFTIIVFGEAILGVINGVSHIAELTVHVWLCFGLGILIVFALWWIFFSTIADRECKKGMWAGNIMSLIYIPMLASLGLVGASFPTLMENTTTNENYFSSPLQIIFGTSITIFLCCITGVSRFLIYTQEYEKPKKFVQLLLIVIGIINVLLMFLIPVLPVLFYLLCVFTSLLIVIIIMTRSWFRIELKNLNQVTE